MLSEDVWRMCGGCGGMLEMSGGCVREVWDMWVG